MKQLALWIVAKEQWVDPMTVQKKIHFPLDLIRGPFLFPKRIKEMVRHTSVGRSYVVLRKVRCQLVSGQVAQVVGLVVTQTGCYDLHASIVALMVRMCVKDGERSVSVRVVQQQAHLMNC